MTLQEYLDYKHLTQADFSRVSGISQSKLNNYIKGRREPRSKEKLVIYLTTHGKVQPNDWYKLPQLTKDK